MVVLPVQAVEAPSELQPFCSFRGPDNKGDKLKAGPMGPKPMGPKL